MAPRCSGSMVFDNVGLGGGVFSGVFATPGGWHQCYPLEARLQDLSFTAHGEFLKLKEVLDLAYLVCLLAFVSESD